MKNMGILLIVIGIILMIPINQTKDFEVENNIESYKLPQSCFENSEMHQLNVKGVWPADDPLQGLPPTPLTGFDIITIRNNNGDDIHVWDMDLK